MEKMGEYFLYHDFQGENLLQIYGLQWDAPEKHKTIFYKWTLLDMGGQGIHLFTCIGVLNTGFFG